MLVDEIKEGLTFDDVLLVPAYSGDSAERRRHPHAIFAQYQL